MKAPDFRLLSTFTAVVVVALAGCRGDRTGDTGVATRHSAGHGQMRMVNPDRVEWREGPASLPPGAQMALLEGDPAKPGVFSIRFKLPAGYRIAPHTHPRVERVTVLSGSLRLGMGATFDESALESLPSGSFFTMPPGMQHFAAVGDQETVIQLNGEGPWGIRYVNPDDDPRRTRRGQR